jgi:hypothetical protein
VGSATADAPGWSDGDTAAAGSAGGEPPCGIIAFGAAGPKPFSPELDSCTGFNMNGSAPLLVPDCPTYVISGPSADGTNAEVFTVALTVDIISTISVFTGGDTSPQWWVTAGGLSSVAQVGVGRTRTGPESLEGFALFQSHRIGFGHCHGFHDHIRVMSATAVGSGGRVNGLGCRRLADLRRIR